MAKVFHRLFTMSLLIALMGLLSFNLGVTPEAQAKPPGEFKIQFMAGRADSAEFALTHGLSTLINKHSSWLRASVKETRGMLDNYALVAKKPANKPNSIICGVVGGSHLFGKTKAEGGFPWGPYTDHRFVARLNGTIHTLVTLDKNIKTIMDMKGKKLADGRKVSTRFYENRMIFEQAGIMDSLKISHGGTGRGTSTLRDGLVDVAVALGIGPVEPTTWIPLPPVQQLLAMKEVYFVNYDKGAFDRAVKAGTVATSPVIVPPKILGKNQNEPILVKYDPLSLLADKSMDPDVVYELLRIFDEHIGELGEYSVTGKWLKRENLGTSGYQTPDKYHPGATKYYREKGIPIRIYR